MMQVFVLSVQNAVPARAIGSATALTQFCRQMGATIGVTVMGVIVNDGLPPGADGGAGVGDPPPAAGAREALADALHPAFLAAARRPLLVWVIARPLGQGGAAAPHRRRARAPPRQPRARRRRPR